MIQLTAIKSSLVEKADQLVEARFKRVVRHGTVVRKQVVRVGFKIVRAKGGRVKIKRMSPVEKRNRHVAVLRSWKRDSASRVLKSRRMTKRSMLRRKAIFGG